MLSLCFFGRFDERISDFYIGHGYFFVVFVFSKNLQICSGSNLIFRGSTFDLF